MKYASSHCTIICIMVSGTSTSSLLSRYAVVVSTRNRSSGVITVAWKCTFI
jgi:hypothetical protein